jgi:hypothetical protein
MFEDRRRAFEAKYEHDQELAFRIRAHRDKLFGLRIAEQLGYRDETAKDYAMRFVIELGPKHDEVVQNHALDSLQRAHVPCTAAAIQAAFDAAQLEAEKELGGPKG